MFSCSSSIYFTFIYCQFYSLFFFFISLSWVPSPALPTNHTFQLDDNRHLPENSTAGGAFLGDFGEWVKCVNDFAHNEVSFVWCVMFFGFSSLLRIKIVDLLFYVGMLLLVIFDDLVKILHIFIVCLIVCLFEIHPAVTMINNLNLI